MLTFRVFMVQTVRSHQGKGELMPTVTSVMADLKKKGSEQTRKIYARHGMAGKPMFGVRGADLKGIAQKNKRQQGLACQLYLTGNFDALDLAGLVANGTQMTKDELI